MSKFRRDGQRMTRNEAIEFVNKLNKGEKLLRVQYLIEHLIRIQTMGYNDGAIDLLYAGLKYGVIMSYGLAPFEIDELKD